MRKFDGRLRGVVVVGAVVVAGVLPFAPAALFGGTERIAAPVPQTIAGASRAAVGFATDRTKATQGSAGSPFHGKPQELFLTRAHSAVFNVKNLKSLVTKKERPEHEDPLGASDDEDAADADSGVAGADADARARSGDSSADMPTTLDQDQMVAGTGVSANASLPSTDSSFAGLDFANWGAGHPPDENGDVGPTYYIQTVNTSVGIYNKSNGARIAAFTFDALMSQGHFGNLCDTDNFGDPVVLYDTFEDRWVITDFAFKLDASGNVVNPPGSFQCFAASKTGDPVSGGWNYYSINTAGGLGDYPKFGIWPDGLYLTTNMFSYPNATRAFQTSRAYAFNKKQMYAGKPSVQVIAFDIPGGDFTV